MVAARNLDNRKIIRELNNLKVKASMASDIWSNNDASLIGTSLYYIDDNFERPQAMFIGCTGLIVLPVHGGATLRAGGPPV